MIEEEWDESLVECIECGAVVADGPDPSYPFGPTATLCFACATRRGGEYDARADRWTRPPDVSGLAAFVEEGAVHG